MNIRRAGRKVVKNLHKEYGIYRIGFVNIYDEDNEIWVVSSSSIECWRGRIYLSNNNYNDTIEIAYSYDDHILDHIDSSLKVSYVCYKKEGNKFKVSNTNLDNNTLQIIDAT